MKKIKFITGAFALLSIALSVVSCDDAETGIAYTQTTFPVGTATWQNVSSEDQQIITNMINNMIKVESCHFYMGAQSRSSKRYNFYSGFACDTIRQQDENLSFRCNRSAKDTTWFETKNFVFQDTINTKREYAVYTQVYRLGNIWVGPVTEVSMPDYYIGKYEVTQQEWMAVMHKAPRGHYYLDVRHPVEKDSAWYSTFGLGDRVAAYNIWFEDALEFCQTLNAKTGLNFRLPTEAEWECAARGGKYTRGYKYPGSDDYYEAGWVRRNAFACGMKDEDGNRVENYGIHAVGEKMGNELGIHDMVGNVAEWVGNSYYLYSAVDNVNPQGNKPLLNGQDTLILRGGSWRDELTIYHAPGTRKKSVQSSYKTEESRQSAFVNCGFRLAL